MNKSVMKCCICNNKNIGRFITINNEKYHLCCINQLQQENQRLDKEFKKQIEEYQKALDDTMSEKMDLEEENKQLKDKLSKIETLIINHNCDTGDIYYKYNSKFLKSELKQRILEIVYEEGSDSDD